MEQKLRHRDTAGEDGDDEEGAGSMDDPSLGLKGLAAEHMASSVESKAASMKSGRQRDTVAGGGFQRAKSSGSFSQLELGMSAGAGASVQNAAKEKDGLGTASNAMSAPGDPCPGRTS